MLDFYLLKDDQVKPGYPELAGLVFAGGLDDKTFGNLQSKGIMSSRFNYYSDFRLDTTLIRQMRQAVLQKKLQADPDVIKLLDLFDVAEKGGSGLVAYGD